MFRIVNDIVYIYNNAINITEYETLEKKFNSNIMDDYREVYYSPDKSFVITKDPIDQVSIPEELLSNIKEWLANIDYIAEKYKEWKYLGNLNGDKTEKIKNLRTQRVQELKVIRDVKRYGAPLTYINDTGNYHISASKNALDALIGKYLIWNGGTTKNFLDTSNNEISLTRNDFAEIIKIIENQHTEIYLKYAALKKSVYNMGLESLESYNAQAVWDAV